MSVLCCIVLTHTRIPSHDTTETNLALILTDHFVFAPTLGDPFVSLRKLEQIIFR